MGVWMLLSPALILRLCCELWSVYTVLGHRRDRVVWGPHLGQNFIKPLQRSMQVDLYPAGGACDILAVVLCTPALWEKRERHSVITMIVHSVSLLYLCVGGGYDYSKMNEWYDYTKKK